MVRFQNIFLNANPSGTIETETNRSSEKCQVAVRRGSLSRLRIVHLEVRTFHQMNTLTEEVKTSQFVKVGINGHFLTNWHGFSNE